MSLCVSTAAFGVLQWLDSLLTLHMILYIPSVFAFYDVGAGHVYILLQYPGGSNWIGKLKTKGKTGLLQVAHVSGNLSKLAATQV